MIIVPLQAIPNQQLLTVLDDNQWDISVRITNGTISVSLALNGVFIIENQRAVAGSLIIPAKYLENGNFAIVTQNQEIPDYTQFGVTQSLIYLSPTELAAYRTPPSLPITAAFFNPIAALPLRFAPQGYTLAP